MESRSAEACCRAQYGLGHAVSEAPLAMALFSHQPLQPQAQKLSGAQRGIKSLGT